MASVTRRARALSIDATRAALGAALDWWLRINTDDSKQASWGHRVDAKKGFPRSLLSTTHGDANIYRAGNPINLWRIRRSISLQPDDVFVDIGCGKGRILCYMARHGIRKAIGIDLDPLLAEVAARNAATLRQPHAPIEIHCGEAAQADYTEATVLLFYNPFGPDTMRAVLTTIERSLQTNPRNLTIVYYDAEFPETMSSCRWLTLERKFRTLGNCDVLIFRHHRTQRSPSD